MRGWELMQQSWSVLKQDKELLVFPILSGIACLLVSATFVAPFLLVPQFAGPMLGALDDKAADPGVQLVAQAAWLLLTFLFYFVNYFVIVFFNTALVSCAIIRFKGGDPTVRDGLAAACARLPQIFAWALLAATVGMILRAIEERAGIIGRFVVGLLGLMWSAATYLVVPILAVEKLGPIDAVKRSVQLLRHCWGDGLVGNFGLGLIGFLLALPGILVLFAAVFLGFAANNLVIGIALILVAVAYLVTLSIVMSALKQVFIAGLYIYAAEERVPEGFDEEIMRTAFTRRKRWRSGRRSVLGTEDDDQ
jgi:hypothetical protein